MLTHGEIFSEKRILKCVDIHTKLLEWWGKKRVVDYTVLVDMPIDGISLEDLRKKYFSIRFDDQQYDVPFIDLIIVFDLLRQHHAAIKELTPEQRKNFKIDYQVSTDWPDEKAVEVLSMITMTDPRGTTARLRFNKVVKEQQDED